MLRDRSTRRFSGIPYQVYYLGIDFEALGNETNWAEKGLGAVNVELLILKLSPG